MAAKPPRPPGNFINSNNSNKTVQQQQQQLQQQKSGVSEIEANDNNAKTNNSNNNNKNSNNNNNNNNNQNCSSPVLNVLENYRTHKVRVDNSPKSNVLEYNGKCKISLENAATKSTPNCNCTNISLMHLFHEMKQEFPTIPDTIVWQCVNENCHQRDNCIQMLRKELDLNPVPGQTYPAKVLHPLQQHNILQQQHQHQQQQQQQQQQLENRVNPKPTKLLKPIRAAPTKPPIPSSALTDNTPTPPANCKSPLLSTCRNNLRDNNNKTNSNCDSAILHEDDCESNIVKNNKIKLKDVENSKSENSVIDEINSIDMPTTTTATPTRAIAKEAATVALNSVRCQQHETATLNGTTKETLPVEQQTPSLPRLRPTTLNLQNAATNQQPMLQQQEQRQQFHAQLQQHIQKRNQLQQQKSQQQQQQQQQQQEKLLQQPKPIRKAPLPPLPPKPTQLTNNIHNNSTSSHSQQSSFSNESSSSCLTSPISPVESDISVNVSLSPSTPVSLQTAYQQNKNQQLKSPQRRRVILNVQPEPPYANDFLPSPTLSNNRQKSYTSVNFTLRQPNSAVPQSTIDISAGPSLGGTGAGGLTYSSTSYDANRGYQKNFHITVTDETGVFSASRIKPRNTFRVAESEQDNSPTSAGGINPLRTTASEQNLYPQNQLRQQQQQQELQQPQLRQYQSTQDLKQQQQQQQQQQSNNLSATNNNQQQQQQSGNDMCLPGNADDIFETLQRQKTRRDRLANALREKKRRFQCIERDVDILMKPLVPGEKERLDADIQRLRLDCEAILNALENARRCDTQPPQSQPFLRQNPWTQANLDFVQHHRSPSSVIAPFTNQSPQQQYQLSTPTTPPPTYQQYYQQFYLPQQQQQQQPTMVYPQQVYQMVPPTGVWPLNSQIPGRPQQPTHSQAQQPPQNVQPHQQHQPQQQHAPQQYFQTVTDDDEEEDYTDTGEDEELLEMWACNMCTFRNHPQLNICECCDNVRIPPGALCLIPNVSNALGAVGEAAAAVVTSQHNSAASAAAVSPASNGNTNLEHDANLTQQQLQQLALHT